jgi:uncharacterized membrane protein
MSDPQSPAAPSRSSGKLMLFRALGAILLIVGLVLTVLALMDFFSTFNDPTDTPDRFWLAFVGLPVTFVGVVLLMTGFAVAGTKYVVREAVPIVKDAMDQLGFQGNAANAPGTGPYCRSCGKQNSADAAFCSSCGTSMT